MKQLIVLFIFFISSIDVYSQTEVELKLELKIGEKFLIENNTASITEQEIMGEKQIIKKDELSTYLFSVLSKANNEYYIEITYKHLRTQVDAQNQIEIIDSDSINNPTTLSEFYHSLINKSFYLGLNNKGVILKVDSLENLFSKELFDSFDENTKTLLEKQFGEEFIKNMPSLTQFPNSTIQEKKSWSFQDTTKLNILNIYNRKQTLQEITEDTYIINKTSEIYTDKNENLNINNIFINYNMKGNTVGSIVLSKNSCMIQESNSKQYVSGTAGMKYSGGTENAYSWPIKMTKTTSVKAYKIEK